MVGKKHKKMNTYLDYYQQLKPQLAGNNLPWLAHARETSMARFVEAGFPNRHLEDWKYTDLTFLAKQHYQHTAPHTQITQSSIAPYQIENTNQLVFVNGRFDSTLSRIENLPTDVVLLSLSQALQQTPEKLAPYFEETASEKPFYSTLIDLNTALASDGVFLYIPKNTTLESPIHFLFLTTTPTENTLLNNRNIILLEENSRAVVFEQHAALDSENTTPSNLTKNNFTTVHLNKGAQLHYYKLQQENRESIHLAQTEFSQARDSQLISHSISLGSRLARDNLTVGLNDIGASCELNGFYALSDKQHTDHHTRVDHYHPHGTSSECYKGILKDHAKGVFNGKVIVHPAAQKTSSQQINKNLLLSGTAEMNTKPELEIYADDVKCTHGATVGQIEPDALFYLRSRGFDKTAATALLMHAFCDEVLQKMKHAAIADCIRKAVMEKIENQ